MAINSITGFLINKNESFTSCVSAIETTESLSTALSTGYLNGDSSGVLANNQDAIVVTTDGTFKLKVIFSGDDQNLQLPLNPPLSSATPTFSSATTATILSSTQDALVSYSFDVTVSISILSGQSITATLNYADDSNMSTNPVTVDSMMISNSGVVGLDQTISLKLSGIVPRGKYRKVTFAVTGSATAPSSIKAGQEVLL